MKQTQIVLRVAAFTVVILSVVPAAHATEPPQVDANARTVGEAFAPGAEEGAVMNEDRDL